jgi:2-polyprenyl-3-methyl-5-hydroxy-6-metoxy-1,4-benzoquinol methylase
MIRTRPAATEWPAWRCPEHRELLEDGPTGLLCPHAHKFPIINGVPRFVSGSNYADHFGAQWNRFRRTQLDSHTGFPITRERLQRCLGEELCKTLSGKLVLECGCGAGRFTEILLDLGAKLTSIDLSSAVDANADQFPTGETHRIAQADITNLPFPVGSFEVVVCLGVIQHTPNPELTIQKLYEQVAPGGILVIDHYVLTLSWYMKTAPLFRIFMKRMQPEPAMKLTELLVNTCLPLQRAVRKIPGVRSIVHRLAPVMSYYSALPQLNDQLQREWALLDTHDSLTDEFKHSRSKEEITKALQSLGATDIWCEYGGNGVEARAGKPIPV